MITILEAKQGVTLTKVFTPDGVQPYGLGKNFKVKSVEVSDIYELSAVLTDLEAKPNACVIRGQLKEPTNGFIQRKAEFFNDDPIHWLMVDVDDYATQLEPIDAILEFITKHLPEFKGRSFHWQLSSSYGTQGKEGLLKAHLWFWLDTPLNSLTLREWAKALPIDRSVFNTVSIHYTAAPIFKGVPNPVTVRSGLYEGLIDSVLLTPTIITPEPVHVEAVVADPEWPLERIQAEVLPNISPNLPNDEWVKVGMALHHQGGGGSEWLHAFDRWSSPGHTYTPDVCEARWDSFERNTGPIVSIGTLLHMANIPRSTVATDDEFEPLDAEARTTEIESAKSRFTWATGGEFNAGAPTGWIIKNLIPKAELGVLYGASSSGKSFKMLDMSMHIVHGWPWRDLKVTQGRVAYLAAEGASGFKNRIKAFAQEFECDIDHPNFRVSRDPVNFLVKSEAKEFALSLVEYAPMLVVIDTFARVTPGGNENSGEDMGRALAHCQMVHDITGAMVILVHHTGKDASKGARGWSGLRAAADWEAEVIKGANDQGRVLVVTKQKDGEDGQEYGFTLRTVNLGFNSDGDVITSCVVEEAEAGGLVRQAKLNLGKLEALLVEEAQNLVGLDGTPPDVYTLIQSAVAQIPFEGAPDKRDQREGSLNRAYKKLLTRNILREEEGRVVVL